MRNSQPDRRQVMSYANLPWFLKAMGDKLQKLHTFLLVGKLIVWLVHWVFIGSQLEVQHVIITEAEISAVFFAPSSASKLPNKWQTSDIHEYSVHWQVWRCICSFDLHLKRRVCEPHPAGCFKATMKPSDAKISNLKHVGEARDSDKLRATN